MRPEASQLSTQRERRIELAEALRELLTVLNSDLSLSGILEHVLERMTGLLDTDAAAVYLLESSEGATVLRMAASLGLPPDTIATRLNPGAPVSGLAAAARRPAAINDINTAIPVNRRTVEIVEDCGSHLLVKRIGGQRGADGGSARLRRLAKLYPAVLAVPLTVRDEVYGAMTVYHHQPCSFAADYVELVTAFAAHSALAIQNSRLREGAERRGQQLAALYQADERMHQSLDLGEVLHSLVEVAGDVLHADKVAVLVWDEPHERLVVGASRGLDPISQAQEILPDDSLVQPILAGQLLIASDMRREPRASPRMRAIARLSGIRASMAGPIIVGGEVFGIFSLHYERPRTFGDEEQRLLQALAERAGLAVQNAQVHTESARRLIELESLYRADEALHRSLRSQDVLQSLCDLAAEILAADKTVVWIWDAQSQRVVVGAGHGLSAAFRAESYAPDEAGIMAAVANNDVVVVEDVQADARMSEHFRQRDAREGVNAWLSATIRIGGEIFGSFVAGYARSRTFGERERRIVWALAQRAAVALQNAELYEHAQRAALENARLHSESDRRARELEALYRADELLYRSLRLDQVLQTLADVATDVLQADMTSVLIWDERHEKLIPGATRGFRPEIVAQMAHAPGEGVTIRVALSGQAIAVEDAANDPRVAHRITDPEGIRSLLHVPIKVNGEVFGVFGVNYRQQRALVGEEERVLLALAHRAALAIENASLFAESERRRDELEALYRADETLHSSLRLDDVLETLVELAISILRADSASVWLIEPGRKLRLRAVRGLPQTVVNEIDRLAWRAPVVDEMLANDVLGVEDIRTDERFPPGLRAVNNREGIRAVLSGRICSSSQVFGIFAIAFNTPRRFRDEEKRLVAALGQRASLAFQNARLFEQAQQAATAEERQRLARELHDAVTQTLFSASLIAEVIPRMWDRDPAEAGQRLDELRRLTRGALAEMRTLLIELRPMALVETPLAQLLGQLAQATASRSNLEVAVDSEGDPRRLPGEVQIALYRIVQEVLNNTAKHANAHRAGLTMAWAADGVDLRLWDDGCGFRTGSIPAGHFGLGIMGERAHSIHARLDLDSQPGSGTRVEVCWRGSLP
jgi:GAF domain-containing protein